MLPEHLGRIRSISCALFAAGFETLDKQADVLSLPRSTTWTIVHGNHKKSGLSAGLLGRMLKSPGFPHPFRPRSLNTSRPRSAEGFGHNSSVDFAPA
jgi:hypothetical protein